MITLKNVTKVYGTKTKVNALRGIDLNIKAGEIFGIIGKSGAGKSTLVRCINMLERPASGHIIIDDRDMVPIGFPKTPEINYGFGLSAASCARKENLSV